MERSSTTSFANAGGRVVSETTPETITIGFAGGIADPLTGLVHFGAREYSPRLHRWLSPDPIGLCSDPNLYRYSDGDPVNRRDHRPRQHWRLAESRHQESRRRGKDPRSDRPGRHWRRSGRCPEYSVAGPRPRRAGQELRGQWKRNRQRNARRATVPPTSTPRTLALVATAMSSAPSPAIRETCPTAETRQRVPTATPTSSHSNLAWMYHLQLTGQYVAAHSEPGFEVQIRQVPVTGSTTVATVGAVALERRGRSARCDPRPRTRPTAGRWRPHDRRQRRRRPPGRRNHSAHRRTWRVDWTDGSRVHVLGDRRLNVQIRPSVARVPRIDGLIGTSDGSLRTATRATVDTEPWPPSFEHVDREMV